MICSALWSPLQRSNLRGGMSGSYKLSIGLAEAAVDIRFDETKL